MRTLATITQSGAIVNATFLEALEKRLLEETQAECPVYHSFGPGLYIRELHMPRGVIALGHIQKFEHQNILLKGAVRMLNTDGTTTDLRAPAKFVGKPGRKVGFVLEDVVWLNIFSTPETDVTKLEKELFEKSDHFETQRLLKVESEKLKRQLDRDDYLDVLREFGISESQVQWEMNEAVSELPYGDYPVKLGDSSIHGRGLFATANIRTGDAICPAKWNGLKTIAGRFTNHALHPNCRFVERVDGVVDLVANTSITGCKGGYDGDELTINYREALRLAHRKVLKCQVLSLQQ